MSASQSQPMDPSIPPALDVPALDVPVLDQAEIRDARRPKRRRWLVPSIVAGLLATGGGAFGLYQAFEAPARDTSGRSLRQQAIKIGPVPDMPDIRDGVPALMTSREGAAVRVVAAPAPGAPAVRPGALSSSSSPNDLLQARSMVPQIDPARRAAAEPLATAPTVANAALRPAIASKPRVESATADSSAASGAATLAPPAAAINARAPVATGSMQATMAEPERAAIEPEAASPRQEPAVTETGRQELGRPEIARIEPARVSSPLPPVRPAIRSSEPPTERTLQADRTPAADRNAPDRTASKTRQSLAVPPASGPGTPIQARPTPRAPEPVEERAEILGMRLPGFVPTGREIRDAAGQTGRQIRDVAGQTASTVADAVTSLNPF